jgi:hypothetical protein
MLSVHTQGRLDPQTQYQALFQEVTVAAAGEASHQACNLHVGFAMAWQIEMVGNCKAIILCGKSQLLS